MARRKKSPPNGGLKFWRLLKKREEPQLPDGLAAGIVAIAGAAFFTFAYLLAVVYGFNRAGAPSLITAIAIGVCLGFLPHNSHPARIFMGDSGSMFLGLMLAASAITLTGQVDPNAISEEKLGPALLPLLLPLDRKSVV